MPGVQPGLQFLLSGTTDELEPKCHVTNQYQYKTVLSLELRYFRVQLFSEQGTVSVSVCVSVCVVLPINLSTIYLSDLYSAIPQIYIVSKVLNKYNLYIIKIYTDKYNGLTVVTSAE